MIITGIGAEAKILSLEIQNPRLLSISDIEILDADSSGNIVNIHKATATSKTVEQNAFIYMLAQAAKSNGNESLVDQLLNHQDKLLCEGILAGVLSNSQLPDDTKKMLWSYVVLLSRFLNEGQLINTPQTISKAPDSDLKKSIQKGLQDMLIVSKQLVLLNKIIAVITRPSAPKADIDNKLNQISQLISPEAKPELLRSNIAIKVLRDSLMVVSLAWQILQQAATGKAIRESITEFAAEPWLNDQKCRNSVLEILKTAKHNKVVSDEFIQDLRNYSGLVQNEVALENIKTSINEQRQNF